MYHLYAFVFLNAVDYLVVICIYVSNLLDMKESGYPKENAVSGAPNNNKEADDYGCELICGVYRSTR